MPGMRTRDGRGVTTNDSGARTHRIALLLGFAGLFAFAGFFLIRPFLGPVPAYGPRPAGTTYAYSFLVVAAFAPYAAAVWATRGGIRLRWALGGIIVLHGLVLPAALTQSQDLYMYLFYGKMWVVHGANPYVDLPRVFSADPWFPWVRWPDQPSVYGPLWTLLTSIPARISPGNLGMAFGLMKALVALIGALFAAGFVTAARARGLALGPAAVLVAWNPVFIASLPLGGHADVLVVAAVIWAVVAHHRRRWVLAVALLATAVLVKAYAGVALLVYLVALARRRPRDAVTGLVVAAGMALLAFAPFWEGWRTLHGVASVSAQASASAAGEVQRLLGEVAGTDVALWAVRIAGLAVLAAVVVVQARRPRFAEDPWPAASAAFLTYVLVTPWFLYWHQVGLLALAAVAASPPVRAAAYTFSGTSMLTASFGGSPWGRLLQALLRYGPPVAALRLTARRSAFLKER
jgi:hypothetical protein